MKTAVSLLLGLSSLIAHAQSPPTILHFTHGQWFDGTTFQPNDFYAERGLLTHQPSSTTNVETVDLHNQFVVPPYGDAHEHMFDGPSNASAFVKQYLADGIFYAQGMTDTTSFVQEVVAAGMVNTPTTVDVTYAHGGLTGTNGHPKEVYEALANGIYTGLKDDQRALVIASHKQAGKSYWELANAADLDRDWPLILAGKPDLIKIYLGHSEQFAQATQDAPQLGRGINPTLVPMIVARAHAAGLKVAAHVETPADIHLALVSGVDELGHTLDYYLKAQEDPAIYRIADADIALAAKRHVVVQATAGIYTDETTPPADVAARQRSQRDNLGRLKAAGVEIVVGSDHYGQDSKHEADYLQSLGLWTNLEMLRMWSVATPQNIFPKRKIAQLQPGYEASFLVLSANPLLSWPAAHQITDRWKQGQHLTVGSQESTNTR